MKAGPGNFVGIDLGTTYSAIAHLDRSGRPVTITNREGERTTPSVVLIESDGQAVVGREAKRAVFTDPDKVALNFKRQMGRREYDRPVAGRRVSPVALSAMVLRKLAQDATVQIGPLAGAVITVPAYFGDTRRKATQDAGRVAGLNVIDLINEPTAAALACAFNDYLARGGRAEDLEAAAIAATAPSTTLVFDLGGGTLDVTLIRISSNRFEVLATNGEARLGGVDWDRRLVEHVARCFEQRFGSSPLNDPYARQELWLACEEAKKTLTTRERTAVLCTHQGRRLRVEITREQFEDLTADLLARTEICAEILLRRAGLRWADVDEVLPVGGSSRMPMVQAMLERISGRPPRAGLPVDELVAHGAAVHAAIVVLNRQRAGTLHELFARPAEREAAEAAARQIVSGAAAAVQDVQLRNVNAHSLGVVAYNEQEQAWINSILIPKDTPLPAVRSKIFGTEEPNQRMVRVRIVEGEARDASACTQVGYLEVTGLPPDLPRGSPIEVIFRYDPAGRLHVRAVDRVSGASAETQIIRETALLDSELRRLEADIGRMVIE